jgi:hypothetical protein
MMPRVFNGPVHRARGRKEAKGMSSITLVGTAVFQGTITFEVETDATVKPWVEVRCTIGGRRQVAARRAGTRGWSGSIGTAATSRWPSWSFRSRRENHDSKDRR